MFGCIGSWGLGSPIVHKLGTCLYIYYTLDAAATAWLEGLDSTPEERELASDKERYSRTMAPDKLKCALRYHVASMDTSLFDSHACTIDIDVEIGRQLISSPLSRLSLRSLDHQIRTTPGKAGRRPGSQRARGRRRPPPATPAAAPRMSCSHKSLLQCPRPQLTHP